MGSDSHAIETASAAACRLLQNEDVAFRAQVLEDLRPHGHGDLPEVRLAEQIHVRPGLADAAADGQRDLVVQDRLVVRQVDKIELPRHLELLEQRGYRLTRLY